MHVAKDYTVVNSVWRPGPGSAEPNTRSSRWHAGRWDRCTDRPVLHGQRWPRLWLADLDWEVMPETGVIRTPDQRVRVFVSSALQELAAERRAVRDAITGLLLVPVMFELAARPHPPRDVDRAYLAQSQVFVGIYWQSYGWVAPARGSPGWKMSTCCQPGCPG